MEIVDNLQQFAGGICYCISLRFLGASIALPARIFGFRKRAHQPLSQRRVFGCQVFGCQVVFRVIFCDRARLILFAAARGFIRVGLINGFGLCGHLSLPVRGA
jgi:hypothetical protein